MESDQNQNVSKMTDCQKKLRKPKVVILLNDAVCVTVRVRSRS